ncbi:hypothetical protein [Carboxylicivirga taeanensis]|uniref:hypothetical protein n=1 Tax=Carboxylicivirga taeanensis TaxID=1416875 RepID=UPI003F6DBFF0
MDYFNSLIEHLAEWFMHLFFDPSYYCMETVQEACIENKPATPRLISQVKEQVVSNLVRTKAAHPRTYFNEVLSDELQRLKTCVNTDFRRYLQAEQVQWLY